MSHKASYGQIIKSTSIIGGSQIISILIGIASTKIVAILLGPVGVGISAIYQSTIDIIRSCTSFGVEFSAVRDVAESAGSNDEQSISRIILVLRRWALFTGLLGMTVTLVFCRQLSFYAFGSDSYAWGIAVLSLAILVGSLSGAQGALLQGMRQISYQAQSRIYGSFIGFLISIPIYYIYGIRGIVPAILLNAVVSFGLSWFFAQKISVRKISLSFAETINRGMGMIRLGFFSVVTGLFMSATMYFTRIYLAKKGGLETVGTFMAAWKISSIYLTSVLSAMGSDYFPRLSAVHEDDEAVTRLVNEQTEIALLIAGPIIILMIGLLPLIIPLLYSDKFIHAIRILEWQLFGDFFKVISFPLAFIILAKAKGSIFIVTEGLSLLVYYALIYLGWDYAGFEIAGMAFLGNYIFYLFVVYLVAKKLCGFSWSYKSKKYIFFYLVTILLSFFVARHLDGYVLWSVLLCLFAVAAAFSYRELDYLLDIKMKVREKLSKLR